MVIAFTRNHHNNEITAKHYLTYISYYRFCGYAIDFEINHSTGNKIYRKGTTFDDILNCYVFDRKLRLLVIDAIERIEIAIRTVITNELALKYGAHWYQKQDIFKQKYKHDKLIEAIKKETLHRVGSELAEPFIEHYHAKYESPSLPAIWMIAEVLPLGSWSIIFANLADRKNQKGISKHFNLNDTVMKSWLHTLTYLRNLCAHHSKLWNRSFRIKPLIARDHEAYLKNNSRFCAQAAILKIFLDVISPNSNWSQHLFSLINEHPDIDIARMGFAKNWHTDSFWSIDRYSKTLPFEPVPINELA